VRRALYGNGLRGPARASVLRWCFVGRAQPLRQMPSSPRFQAAALTRPQPIDRRGRRPADSFSVNRLRTSGRPHYPPCGAEPTS
jgi:hypothetical protein